MQEQFDRSAQLAEAGRRSNEVRAARAQLKLAIRTGVVDARDVLFYDEDYVQRMSVFDILKAMRYVGPGKARRMLSMCHLSTTVRLEALSDVRRRQLAGMIADIHKGRAQRERLAA